MDKAKREGLLRLRLNGILYIFWRHDMEKYVQDAIEDILKAVRELYDEG